MKDETIDPSAGASIADSLTTTPTGHPTAADIQTARAISLRTGEPISEIARGIALDRVREGGAKPVGIMARLTKALLGEKQALAVVAAARAERFAALAKQTEWENMERELRGFADPLAFIEKAVEEAENMAAGARAGFPTAIRQCQAVVFLHAQAEAVATADATLPILREAAEQFRGLRAAHVRKMLEWGKANGVDSKTLAAVK